MIGIGKLNYGFEKLCHVEANLGGMKNCLIQKYGSDGPYEVLEFFLVIEPGGTELCARIEWIEKVRCVWKVRSQLPSTDHISRA
jgi:hypothetical protein